MKLGKVRAILAEYEKEKGWWQWFFGDALEVGKLKKFLQSRQDKADDDALSESELIDVIKIGLVANNFTSMQFLKEQWNLPYYLPEIFARLNQAGLLNEVNFRHCYHLNFSNSHSLWRVLSAPEMSDLPLTQAAFDLILVLYRYTPPLHRLRHNILALTTHHLVDDNMLSLIEIKHADFINMDCLVSAILALNEAHLLDDHIELMKDKKCDQAFFELIALLADAKLLDGEIVSQLINRNSDYFSTLKKNIVLLGESGCLDKSTLLALLNKDEVFQYSAASILTLLSDRSVLNVTSWEMVLLSDNLFALKTLLKCLARANLLNQPAIHTVLPYTNYEFLAAIEYLSKENLLTENSINRIAFLYNVKQSTTLGQLLREFGKINFHINLENLNRLLDRDGSDDLSFIFSTLITFNLVTNNNLTLLLDLSSRNIKAAKDMLVNLGDNNRLNQSTFNEALACAKIKLPLIVKSTMVKQSRKETGAPRSSICVDNKMTFFSQPDDKQKGYQDVDSDRVVYQVKTVNSPFHVEAQAKREVKFNRLLGRESYYFGNQDKMKVVSTWQAEKGLDELDILSIQSQPLVNRLNWLISGLSDLNILHAHQRIHGNINPQSFIINLDKAMLSLVDFSEARRRFAGTFSAEIFNNISLASFSDTFNFSDDIYAMGMLVAHIFPELILLKHDETGVKDISGAMLVLMKSMMHPSAAMRCSCQEAIHYCQALLMHTHELNKDEINNIAAATIHRETPSVDDVLHGVSRFKPKTA